MIRRLSIRNFKSIKELNIDCKKVNLFIGEPNTGKSNILEALGLLSWCGHGKTPFKEYIRFRGIQNLFYDELLDSPIEIELKDEIGLGVKIEYENHTFHMNRFYIKGKETLTADTLSLDFSGTMSPRDAKPLEQFDFIKFFTFR